jgi:predicted acyl esterase
MIREFPEILEQSTGRHQNWETPDPERFVPHGYAIVRVDSRGTGWTPGFLNYYNPQETEDVFDCIEWAGTQEWSSGKVGLTGISYFAENQWRVASRESQSEHLAAILPWEGQSDVYRELHYHGGILSEFQKWWEPLQSRTVQYGVGERGARSRVTGEPVAGPVTLPEDELAANRIRLWETVVAHPLDDEFHKRLTPDLPNIKVPLLSAANWGGQGQHPRGNFNGFVHSGSEQKWLEAHGGSHWAWFYSDYGVDLQLRFFDHFLKGADNGWDAEPSVQLHIRRPGERFVPRMEHEWPLERTQWTRLHLRHSDAQLASEPDRYEIAAEYDAMGDGLTFWLPASDEELEITGPLAAKLFVSSETEDADLFLVLRLFDPDGAEVTFQGSTDPNTPIANGWLRASHRALDPERTLPYQPYHPHDRVEPLTPGEVYELDVEIWPTCIVVPPGYRLALNVRGKDYEYEGPLSQLAEEFLFATRGTGGQTHADPESRPPEIFGGKVTLHSGGESESYLLLPVIPREGA